MSDVEAKMDWQEDEDEVSNTSLILKFENFW